MTKILLIGNSGDIAKSADGQVTKVRLYRSILVKEKIDFTFVDLENFSRHPISIFIKIRKNIKKNDRIILLTAQRGVRLLIPFINFCNRKSHKPFILPMIGVNILHKYIDDLNESEHVSFMHDFNFLNIRPKKRDIDNLKKISLILPENEIIANVIRKFFNISNVEVLQNFRIDDLVDNHNKMKEDKILKLIFLSRVAKEKGIFKLIDAVNHINSNETLVKLDIYGNKYFTKEEDDKFNSNLNENIQYKGAIDNNIVIKTISLYDLFIFPTQYKSEGTPGVISESLIAGVPIISSNFVQVNYLLKPGFDSLIYDMGNDDELVLSILSIVKDKNKLKKLFYNAKLSGKRYTYHANRDNFFKYILGIENSESN